MSDRLLQTFSLEHRIKEVLSQRLSSIIAGAVLRSACQRCSILPAELTDDDLSRVAQALDRSLSCYLEPDEVHQIVDDLSALASPRRRASSNTLDKVRTLQIRSELDVHRSRTLAMEAIKECGHTTYEAVKVATVVSELTRNVVQYAGQGELTLQLLTGRSKGIRIVVQDDGPGIPHLEDVLSGTYRSRTGRGKGILASQRVMDTLEIETAPGKGTKITAEKRC